MTKPAGILISKHFRWGSSERTPPPLCEGRQSRTAHGGRDLLLSASLWHGVTPLHCLKCFFFFCMLKPLVFLLVNIFLCDWQGKHERVLKKRRGCPRVPRAGDGLWMPPPPPVGDAAGACQVKTTCCLSKFCYLIFGCMRLFIASNV